MVFLTGELNLCFYFVVFFFGKMKTKINNSLEMCNIFQKLKFLLKIMNEMCFVYYE